MIEITFATRTLTLPTASCLWTDAQTCEGAPTFQFYPTFHWQLRRRVLMLFQQAVRKVTLFLQRRCVLTPHVHGSFIVDVPGHHHHHDTRDLFELKWTLVLRFCSKDRLPCSELFTPTFRWSQLSRQSPGFVLPGISVKCFVSSIQSAACNKIMCSSIIWYLKVRDRLCLQSIPCEVKTKSHTWHVVCCSYKTCAQYTCFGTVDY